MQKPVKQKSCHKENKIEGFQGTERRVERRSKKIGGRCEERGSKRKRDGKKEKKRGVEEREELN